MPEERNLCKSCWSEAECFLKKGIYEKTECSDYEPMSMEEMDERDRFIDAIFIGDCPYCASTRTENCENNPFIENITIGYCANCETYWCSDCGHIFEKDKKIEVCPHDEICEQCMEENNYLDREEFHDRICPGCEQFDFISDCCQLDDPLLCENDHLYQCPYISDVSSCPRIREHIEKFAE